MLSRASVKEIGCTVPLRDVTPEGVRRAVAAFDALGREQFLKDSGFGEARGYWLRVGTRRYDSKAIVGVAHGFDRPDLGRLVPSDFGGGDATVASRLEALGFEVERPVAVRRNPPWNEDELVLALDVYLEYGMLDDRDPRVIELSNLLNELARGTDHPDAERFRNGNGVAPSWPTSPRWIPRTRGAACLGAVRETVRFGSATPAIGTRCAPRSGGFVVASHERLRRVIACASPAARSSRSTRSRSTTSRRRGT